MIVNGVPCQPVLYDYCLCSLVTVAVGEIVLFYSIYDSDCVAFMRNFLPCNSVLLQS